MDLCFYIRRCDAINKSGQTSIYCTITINKIPSVPFSTGIKVIAKNWLPKKKTTSDEHSDNVRRELNNLENLLRKIKLDLQETEKVVTANSIKEKFLSIRKNANQKPEPKIDFLEMAKKFNENKVKKGASKSTQRSDISHLRNIELYIKYAKIPVLGVADIDLEFIENFSIYFEHDLKMSRNYKNRHILFISNVLDMCVLKKLIKHNPLLSLSLNYEEINDTDSLTIKEIELLETSTYLNEIEVQAVDIFLFMLGTGCDHCDYLNLTNENIIRRNNKVLIRHERQKTVTYLKRKPRNGNPIVKDCALKILEKYGSIDNMPTMSLKQINYNLKKIGKRLNIHTRITTKRARKTFTNISINKELHTDEQTAFQLGHSTTKQLKHYREYDEQILSNLLA